jgi:uncharacterized protein
VLVNIDEIEAAGDLAKAWDVSREQVDEMVSGEKAGYRATAPAHVQARLTLVDRRVVINAHSRVQLTCPCGRCLAPAAVDLPVDFELTLVPLDEYQDEPRKPRGHEAGKAPVEGSFETSDVEEDTYQGKRIDLDPIYREQLLLALPGYPVCQEACKGLCPVCGTNLNERDCGCDPHVPDPRWAGLKKLKL